MKRIIVWITVLSLILAGVFAMNACNRRVDENGVSYQVNMINRDEYGRVIVTYGEDPEDYLSHITVTRTENGVSREVPVDVSMLVTPIDTTEIGPQILQFSYSGQMFSVSIVIKYKVEFVVDGKAYRTYHVLDKEGLDNIKGILEDEAREASGLGEDFNPNKLKLHELLAAPEKPGYGFVGWSEEGHDASEKVKISNNFPSVIKDNITFTAIYEPALDQIPELSEIEVFYREKLANIKLPGSVVGEWQLKDSEGIFDTVGDFEFEVQFVEFATGTVLKESTVTVHVVKRELPELSVIDAVYGDLLADIELPSSDLGEWQFANAEGTVGDVGKNTFEVQFVEFATGEVLDEGTVTINVVKQDAPELPELPIIDAVYGDLLADIELPSFDFGAWKFENAEGTVGNAGENTFVVQFVEAETNEVLEERTITIRVAKKTVNFLNVVESFVYNGKPQLPTFQTDAPELDTEHIQFNGDATSDVGLYEYSFEIVDDNYEGTLEGTYEIKPAVVTVVIQIEKDTVSVGEAIPTVQYEISGLEGMSAEEIAQIISIIEPEVDDIGEYTITATTSNTNIDLQVTPATFTVKLGKLNVGAPTLVSKSATYGDTLADLLFEDNPYGWWEWVNPNDTVGDVVKSEDWQGHLAVFTPIASNKYAQEYYYVKEIDVQQKKLTIQLIQKEFDFNGQEHAISYIVTDDDENIYTDLNVLGNMAYTNAGVYPIELVLNESNYTANVVSDILTINKIDPKFEVDTNLTETWKPELTLGQITLPTAPNGYFVWGDWMENKDESAAAETLNAGSDSYDVTFIPNDEVNYNRVLVTFQVKINKATPVIEGINSSYEFIYNGNIHKLPDATVNPDKYVDTPVFEYTYKDGTPFTGVTEAGTYVVVVTLCEGESGNYESAQIEVTVTVTKADPQKPTQLQNATYGDLAKDILLPEHAEGKWSIKGIDDTTTVGAVGQHVFVAIFTPTTGNYNAIEVPITVNVAKKSISVPAISKSNETQVYTGALLTSGLTSAEGYTVIDNGGINVGTYKVQIVLDTTSYEWSSFETESTFELTYSIVRADNAWSVEPTIKSEWTYGDIDGLDEDALAQYKGIASAFYGEVVVLYAPQGTENFGTAFPTIAGKYTAKFIVTDSNYNDLVKTIDFTVNKKVISTPAYTDTYLYTGSDITADIPMSILYSIAGNVEKNAGEYKATLTLTDSVNYKWSDSESDSITLGYKIISSGIAASITINGWTYGQTANAPVVTINKTFSDEVPYIVEYSDDGAAWSTTVPVNAGSYTVRVKVEDTANYAGVEATCTFTIAKAAVTIDGVNDTYSKNYDGDEFTIPTATASNGDTVKVTITKNGEAVDAIIGTGEYVITYSVAEGANYLAAARTVDVIVNGADVTISKPVIEGWTYGASAKTPSAGFNEIFAQISNGEITFKYFTNAECTDEIATPVNAGTYYVKAIFAGNDNLNAAESEATAFTIAKKVVAIPTVSNKSYNGQNQTSGLIAADGYTVIDNGGINVGSYTAKATLVSANYIWSDGTSEAKELTYSITPIENTEAFENLAFNATYGDLLGDVITLPAGVQGTWSIENATDATTVGNAGVNTFKAIFTPDATGNYNAREVEITVTVAKATVNVPTDYTKEYVYTGSNITAVIPTSTLYTITNNVAKNVGSYNATLTLTDSANYTWSNGDTLTTTVSYSVTKATVTLSGLVLEGWTYGQVANVPTVTVNKSFADDVTVYFEYSVDGATWSKTVPAKAGNYEVRAVVDSDIHNNYVGYVSEAYAFVIAKANASINGVGNGDILNKVYNGTAYVFPSDIKASHGESVLQYVITKNGTLVNEIVNAGEYKVVITLAESANYNEAASVEFTVQIAKADSTDTVITEQNATYGDAISKLVLPISEIGTWTIKENLSTVGNAGTNTFTALFTPNTENYNSCEVIITVTVAKAVVEKPIINPVEYTGERLYSGLVSNDIYTVVDNGGVDHGEYDIVLTLVDPDNYKWETSNEASITVEFVISTAINKWVEGPTITTWEYESAGDHRGQATALYGGVLIEYKLVDAPESAYSTELPTVPGDYIARFTTTDDNYTILTATKLFSITKRKITPPTQTQTSIVYTGSNITSGLTNGIGYAVVADEGRINVGSFTATVSLTSEYYVWADGTSEDKTFTYNIIPATNTEEITLEYTATYGDFITNVITLPAGVEGIWSIESVTDDTTVGNVGTRTFTAIFTPNATGNYNRREVEITVTVEKASVTPPTVTKQEGIEYTGNKVSSGVLSTDLYTATDIGGVVVGTHKVQLTLTDKNNYKWQDGDSDDLYIDYVTIIKAQNRDEIPTYTATYGDSLATLALPTSTTGSWKWQTITVVGNVGETNEHTLVFTPADAANYDIRTVVVTVTVNPKKVTAPAAIPEANRNQVYTGEELFSGLTNGEGYIVSDNGGINVGSYTAVVSLASQNYIWADGTTAAKELTYNIVSAENTEDITLSYTATYGDLIANIITLPAGVEGTWSIENVTAATTVGNVGVNTFKAIFTPDATGNYNRREVEITVTVGKATVNVPTEYTKEYTYTGSNITAVIPTSDLYTVTNNVAKTVGSYSATLSLTDSANYKWNTTDSASVTVSYSIIKASVTLSDLVLGGWTYGQTENVPTVIITKDFADTVTASFEYLVNGAWVAAAPTAAGTYTVKAEVAGTANYTGAELTAEFTIAKAGVAINGANDSYTKVYDGTAFTLTGITASNGATVTKVITKNGEAVDAIIGAGEYVITYSVAESANYLAATREVTVTVAKANVTISAPAIEGWTYLESAKTPSAGFNETFAQGSNSEITFKYYTDAACTVEITDPVNAGTYYVKAVFAGNDNLNAAESAATAFVIAKKVIETPTVANKVYNGQNQTTGLTSDLYTVAEVGSKDVATYTVTLTLNTPANYAWDSVNNDSATTTVTYSITKASVAFEGLAITGWESGKFATQNEPTVTVVKDFAGDVAVSFEYYVNGAWGTTVPTLAGDYAVRAVVADTDNYDGATSAGINFKITVAVVTPPTDNQLFTYTGSAQKPTMADSTYYTVEGTLENTAAGTYSIKIVPVEIYSFVWAGEEGTAATEKTLTYTIEKASVALSGLTMNGWTYNETASTPAVTVTKSFSDAVTVLYEYFTADGTSLGATRPTNAGTYKVKATVNGTDNYNGATTDEKEFTISKASATLSTPVFTGGKNNKFYLNQIGYSTNGLTATHASQTVTGNFAFGALTFVAGSGTSYIDLTFTPADTSNYASVTVRHYLDIVTVAINDTTGTSYGSIETALKAAVSGNTIRVMPHDGGLGAIYIVEDVEIKSGVTLILPYGVDGSGVNAIGTDGSIDVPAATQTTGQYVKPADETLCHVKVILADGKKITNNGTLQIAGQLSGGSGAAQYAGFTAGEHARLVLGKDAQLINNGTIYAAGFIRELDKNNGSKVTLNNGSILYQPFTLKDFPGGSVTYAIYGTMGKSEPITAFSRFVLMNVSPEMHINYGGSVKTWALLWAGDQINQTIGDIVGYGANNISSVIALTDETYSYLTAKYDVDTEVCDLDIYGGAKTNALKLSVKVMTTVNVSTADALFAISYHYDVALHKAEGQTTATFNMDQRYKIMTGAKFTVGEGVILNANEMIVYEKFEDIRSDAYADPNHPMRYPVKPAAIFTVNGEFIVNKFGGKIYSDVAGAKVTINTQASYTAYELKTSEGSSFMASVKAKNPITENAVLVGTTGQVAATTGVTWTVGEIIMNPDNGEEQTTVRFFYNPASPTYPTLPDPTKDGFAFQGWYSGETLVKTGDALTSTATHTLTAKWSSGITVGLDADGDGVADSSINITSDEEQVYPDLGTPTKTGYTFLGWYYGSEKVEAGQSFKVNANHVLTAKWEAQSFTITVTTSNATVTGVTNGQTAKAGDTITITVSFSQTSTLTLTVTDASGNQLLNKSAAGTYTFTMPGSNVTINASSKKDSTCIVEGTLITLADGTQKKVEDLTHEDLLLIFNHETGKMEPGYVAMLDHLDMERMWTNVINLVFSNGETLRVVWNHGVFDVTLNEYVLVNESNYRDFVGHQFYSSYYNGSEFVSELVTLTDAFITNEYIRVYNPTSYWHMNYFANGILNVTAAPADHVGGHVNIFELDEDMKYDAEQMQADIEKYGLYTYDDFAEYLTEEQFYALPFAYLKVAVGKGNIDWESIMQIVEYIKAGSLLD